jgi:GGDEF domain-containing protein
MKRNAAKPRRKTAAPRRPARASSLPAGSLPAEAPKPKRPVRSTPMQLAAEVERLAAELERSRARIADLEAKVDIDPLTDLLNRRGFGRELKRSVAYVKRYGVSAALIFLDLDGFKPVNDRHGHAAGDAVLKAVAAAIVGQVRASDGVARLGGDEFAVLLFTRRRCSGALRRLWSEHRPAWRWQARSIPRVNCSLAPTPPCTTASMPARRALAGKPCRRRASPQTSRNNIRRELIFDEGNPIPQIQLPLFQPLYLNHIGAGRILQGCNGGIQVTMLLQQARQLRPKLLFFLFRHFRLVALRCGPAAAWTWPGRVSGGRLSRFG